MLPTRNKQLESESARIARQTAEFLAAGGKVRFFDNAQTEYSKSGAHNFTKQTGERIPAKSKKGTK